MHYIRKFFERKAVSHLTKYLQENFRLLKLVHSSDKTKLWLVEDLKSKEKFLLKVIGRTNLLYSQLSGIKNSALPKIFYVEENDEATYVVEEFLRGSDLQKYFETHGALDEQTACRLAIEICDALKELHKWHIIHRDIKPSNLFLTEEGEFKLIDFDAARMEKPGRFADTRMIGTPGFAAPEQYGFHQTDERTDIFSLGLTLKILLGYEKYRGYLSPVIEKCIEFDPNKRFQSAESLRRAIIRRKRFHRWKKFLVVAGVSVVGLVGYFFQLPVEAPAPVEIPAVEKIQLTESKPPSVQSVAQEVHTEQPTKPEESFAAEENFIPPEEPIYYDEPAPQPTTNPAPTEEVAQKNSAPKIDYSAADSSELTGSFMPREVFARDENWSEEETNRKYDEYTKRVELGRRVNAFRESLPDDLSKEERNVALTEFNRRAKDALGLK